MTLCAVAPRAGRDLNLAEDVFKLGHLLEAQLLAKREAVEDLATAAIKEEAIERKLGAISAEWGEAQLTFQEYKSRGLVALKVCAAPHAISLGFAGLACKRDCHGYPASCQACARRVICKSLLFASPGLTLYQVLTPFFRACIPAP